MRHTIHEHYIFYSPQHLPCTSTSPMHYTTTAPKHSPTTPTPPHLPRITTSSMDTTSPIHHHISHAPPHLCTTSFHMHHHIYAPQYPLWYLHNVHSIQHIINLWAAPYSMLIPPYPPWNLSKPPYAWHNYILYIAACVQCPDPFKLSSKYSTISIFPRDLYNFKYKFSFVTQITVLFTHRPNN
jgi:hypothetical protein